MPDSLGLSKTQEIGTDTMEPQELPVRQGTTQKSYKGVITLARRGKKGRKH